MRQAVFASIAFAFFYGLTTVLQQKYVRTEITPLHLNFLSYLIGSLFLTLYLFILKRKDLRMKPKTIWYGSLAGFFGSVLGDLFVLFGLTYSSSINWGILSTLSVFITFFLAVVFLREKVTLFKIIASIISFIGAILVIYNFKSSVRFNWGDLLFLGATVSFSISNVINQAAYKYASITQIIYLRFIITALIMFFLIIIFNPINKVNAWGFVFFNTANFIVGISLVIFIIKKAGAYFFTIARNLVPICITVFAIFLLKDFPTLLQMVGGLLIIISIFIFQIKKDLLPVKK